MAAVPGIGASSVIGGLRRLQHPEYRARTHDKEIPGYEGQLVARYRALEFKEINRLLRSRGTDADAALTMNVDMLAKACQEMFVYIGDDVVPLREEAAKSLGGDPDRFDSPIRFDGRLAEVLGIDTARAREVILGMRWSELEIADHADDVFNWMRRASDSADGALAGK